MSTHAYYERYWSNEGYRPLRDLPVELRRELLAAIPSDARCLDVGCGDGRSVAHWLVRHVGDYTGVDVSKPAIEHARSVGLDARVIEDAAGLPFEDGSFDLVTSFEVLEHLFAPHEALAEMLRVLRPGGRLFVTVPNAAYWRRRVELGLRGTWNPYGDDLSVEQPWRDPHIRFFTAAALRRMVETAGFVATAVRGHEGEVAGTWRLAGVARARPGLRARLAAGLNAQLTPLLAPRLHAVAERPG